MFHEKIKSLFSSAIHSVSSAISEFTVNPSSDLTRDRKLPVVKLIIFLVSQGASRSKNELLDFFDMEPQAPTASALNQQRAKLKPETLEMVFRQFNSLMDSFDAARLAYRFIAADGSTFTFFSKPSFSLPECYISEGHSAKGFYSMHLNAFYDLQKHTYTDALIQSVHFRMNIRLSVPWLTVCSCSGTKDCFYWGQGILFL